MEVSFGFGTSLGVNLSSGGIYLHARELNFTVGVFAQIEG
jgi:hypothetical protein